MNLRIENVGKVRCADVKLNGITVIAGPNGSGKSAISRVLYVLHRLTHWLDYYVEQEKARSVINNFFGFAQKDSSVKWYGFFPYSRYLERLFSGKAVIKSAKMLNGGEFWSDPQSVYEYFASYVSLESTGRQLSADEIHNQREKFCDEYRKIIPRIREFINNQENDKYQRSIIQRSFGRVFKGQISSLFSSESSQIRLTVDGLEGEQSVVFNQSNLVDFKINVQIAASESFYLDTWHLLDIVDWSTENLSLPYFTRSLVGRYEEQSSCDWTDYVFQKRNVNPTPEEIGRHEDTMSILNSLASIIHGHLIEKNGEIVFEEEESRGAIRVRNVASGAKSMATIYRAFENGWLEPGDVLIIDEPESNLHPEWQVRFAEFLVLLNRHLDVKLLLNTHSPYFLMAIQKFSRREEVEKAVSFYEMRPDDDQTGFRAYDVTGCTEEIYRAMARPFDELRVL